jgi:hypothetical protein
MNVMPMTAPQSQNGNRQDQCCSAAFSCVDHIQWRLASGDPGDILGNQVSTRIEHAFGPAGHVRRHDNIAQCVEWLRSGERRFFCAGIAIPDIQCRAGSLRED